MLKIRNSSDLKKGKVEVIIPENLCIDTLFKEFPPDFATSDKNKDRLLYIVHLVTEIGAYNPKKVDKNNMIPIKAETVRNTVRNAAELLEYLVKCNVLKTDNYFILNKKCIHYGFVEESKFTLAYLSTYEKWIGKRMIKGKRETSTKHRHLRKYFNSKLTIDFDKAKNWVDKNLDGFSWRCNMLRICQIAKGDFYFYVDKTSGRLHTNLTTLKKELRNFLTYDGRQLVSLDIKNSQPFFSLLLLNPLFYDEYSSVLNYSKVKVRDSIDYITMYKIKQPTDSKGFEKYTLDVQNGILYDIFQTEIENLTGQKFGGGRGAAKQIMFLTLFSRNRSECLMEVNGESLSPKRLFQNLYPEVYKVFKGYKKTDHSLLACILQRLESILILDIITKQCSHLNTPIFTIHDSIACYPEHADEVKDIMINEITSRTGNVPCIELESWKH